MRKWNSEAGMSLVEATIILMTLAILTAVIAPSAGDYINEARNVKAKEDVEAIGTGILRLLRDTGSKCLQFNAANGCTSTNRIDLLLSGDTTLSTAAKAVSAADSAALTGTAATPYNWAPAANAPTGNQVDTIENQLVTNTLDTTNYTSISANFGSGGGGPRAGLGWRGAYLTGPIGKDPWGYKYQANTAFLGVASDAATGGGEGNSDGGWSYNTVVLSPGANGVVETSFAAKGNSAGGDDVIYVIKGSTR
jgi:type II secretory pathway pseudopilin PulG